MGVRVPWKTSSHLAGTGAVLPSSGFMVRWISPPAMHHFSALGGIFRPSNLLNRTVRRNLPDPVDPDPVLIISQRHSLSRQEPSDYLVRFPVDAGQLRRPLPA